MLDPRYSAALAALQEQERVSAALVAFDWDAGSAEDAERLKAAMAAATEQVGRYRAECGRILQITIDADDPDLAVLALTP